MLMLFVLSVLGILVLLTVLLFRRMRAAKAARRTATYVVPSLHWEVDFSGDTYVKPRTPEQEYRAVPSYVRDSRHLRALPHNQEILRRYDAYRARQCACA